MRTINLKITKKGILKWKGADISWHLKFREKHASLDAIDPSAMKTFSCKSAGTKTICRWRGHDLLGEKFQVEVTWKINDKRLSGTIGWSGGRKQEPVEEVCFPVAIMPMPADGRILSAHFQGLLINNISDASLRPDGLLDRKQVLVMQCSALISEKGSFYFDQRDTEFYAKGYEYRALKNHSQLCYKSIHFVPINGNNSVKYTVPYELSVVSFKGGWFEAAGIYKNWARRQWWANRRPVDSRLRDIAMWVWNRGKAENAIEPLEKLQADAGVPVALDWYWWHKHGYDTSYPDYWPPREGSRTFKKALCRLNRQDIFTQVYINGMTWDMDAEHWKKGGESSAVIRQDGEIAATMFNVFAKRRLARMCGGGNEPFRKKIRKTVKKLWNAGLPGVYLDMIGCGSYMPCYNKKHLHPTGSGNYQVRGYRKMLSEILKENPGIILSTEEASEAYMDLFDCAISLAGGTERIGISPERCEPIPVFSAVYHGLTAMFGNYAMPDSIPPFDPKWPKHAIWKKEKAWHKLYPDQFFLEVARAVTWGLQPTVANLKMKHTLDPEFAEIYEFLIRTARFYHSHRDFLFDGDMLPPGKLITREITVTFLARSIFTGEGKQKIFQRKMPAVLHSLWRAADGRTGLILANYSREKQKFQLKNREFSAAGDIQPRSWMFMEQTSRKTHLK